MTKKTLKVLAERAASRARIAGKKASKQLVTAVDDALVAQGKAARARQRKRAFKSALKVVGKAALVLGAGAATVAAVRATKEPEPKAGRER
ncbi:MAG TPA: hypothetical protein VG454_13205 [Gemmatimonadales bacterium]|nr:hypothetical protein [Gemmatimonadales bacterium]